MFNAKEARRLLAGLQKEDPFKELEDIASWLDTLKDAQGFRPEVRAEISMLIDEAMQPLYAELLKLYLGAPHLLDFKGKHLWQGLHRAMKTLAEAYTVCIQEYQHVDKKSFDYRELIPVICTRLLRAVAEQMKLQLMHYVDIEQGIWDLLCSCYIFAEDNRIADRMIFAYPKQVIHTSAQRELARALMLYVSSPGALAPDQIEVSFRIAARMAGGSVGSISSSGGHI